MLYISTEHKGFRLKEFIMDSIKTGAVSLLGYSAIALAIFGGKADLIGPALKAVRDIAREASSPTNTTGGNFATNA